MEHPETIEFRKGLYDLIEKYGRITAYDLSKVLILQDRKESLPDTVIGLKLPSDVTHAEVMRTNVKVGWHLKRMDNIKRGKPQESYVPTKQKYFWSLK